MLPYLHRRPREIALMFARTCNIVCRHCGIESSPWNRSRMKLEDAPGWIIEAAAIPDFHRVTFTGGEPFLFQDEHAELIGLCTRLGLTTRVVTNGFWASKLESGMRVLERMKEAGLGELNFSADKYHLEFLDAGTLRNALECARRMGYARIVSFVTNTDDPPLDDFSAMYGIPREQLLELRPLLAERQQDVIDELKEEKIFIFAGGLIGLGRAAEHPEELRYFPASSFPAQRCQEVLNKPVIYPDGDFQACCCAGGKIKTFTVGNAHRESLADLFAAMSARSHYRMINSHGPKELYDCVRRARPDLPRSGEYTSVCELCVRATDGLTGEEVERDR